jgi:hypothetical protein
MTLACFPAGKSVYATSLRRTGRHAGRARRKQPCIEWHNENAILKKSRNTLINEKQNSRRAKMSKYFFSILFIFLLIGCHPKQQVVELKVPNAIKTALEKKAPAKDYGFYCIKTASPTSIDDFKDWTLIVCCADDNYIDIDITIIPLEKTNSFLFKSSKSYSISKNISGSNPDEPSAVETVSQIENSEHVKIPIDRQGLIFGKGMTPEKLLPKCIQVLRENPKSLLLTKRSTGAGDEEDLVELKMNSL